VCLYLHIYYALLVLDQYKCFSPASTHVYEAHIFAF